MQEQKKNKKIDVCNQRDKTPLFEPRREQTGFLHLRKQRRRSRIQTVYPAFLIRSCSVTDKTDVFFMCGVYVTYVWCVEVATYAGTDPGSESYIQAVHTQMIRCR